MMTSVVFGATTATTTAYDLDASTFDVQTVVTGANNATKLTYVLYNGATPDEDTIIYIDQKDGSSTHTFAVNDIAAADFVGSDIIANDDVSDDADTAPVGDFYKLTRGTMTGIENVTFATADGTVYDFGKDNVAYLPVGVDVTATFFAEAGKTLATVSQGAVALNVNGNTAQLLSDYDVNETVVLDATVTEEASGSFVAVDPNPIIDAANKTVTFLVSTTNVADVKLVGLNVKISGNISATLEDMRSASTDEDFGIQITDTKDLGLVGGNTYSTSVSYNGVKLDLVAGTNYYVVD
jgi:hypothetical protein